MVDISHFWYDKFIINQPNIMLITILINMINSGIRTPPLSLEDHRLRSSSPSLESPDSLSPLSYFSSQTLGSWKSIWYGKKGGPLILDPVVRVELVAKHRRIKPTKPEKLKRKWKCRVRQNELFIVFQNNLLLKF